MVIFSNKITDLQKTSCWKQSATFITMAPTKTGFFLKPVLDYWSFRHVTQTFQYILLESEIKDL